MKFSSLTVLAVALPMSSGFVISTNQRQLGSKNINRVCNNVAHTSTAVGSMSMNLPSFVSAGIVSFGLFTSPSPGVNPEPSAAISLPSTTVSSTSLIDENTISSQSPSALKEAEKKLAKELKEAEREARKDARVSFILSQI